MGSQIQDPDPACSCQDCYRLYTAKTVHCCNLLQLSRAKQQLTQQCHIERLHRPQLQMKEVRDVENREADDECFTIRNSIGGVDSHA